MFLSVDEPPIFVNYEEMPEFGCNKDALKLFFRKKLIYPQTAIDDSIQGKVFLFFVIEADGKVTNARIIRSLKADLDNEVLRVANLMPNWKPGKQKGRPVRVGYSFPVVFSLDETDKKATVVYRKSAKGNFELKLFPNPARDLITIEATKETPDLEYTLFTISGQAVGSGKILSNREQVNVSHLASGQYLMKFVSNKNQISKTMKLIISK